MANCYASMAAAPTTHAVLFVGLYATCIVCFVRFVSCLSKRKCSSCGSEPSRYLSDYRAHISRWFIVITVATAVALLSQSSLQTLHLLKVISIAWLTYILAAMMLHDRNKRSDIASGTHDPSFWLALALSLCAVMLALMPQVLVSTLQIPVYAYGNPYTWH